MKGIKSSDLSPSIDSNSNSDSNQRSNSSTNKSNNNLNNLNYNNRDKRNTDKKDNNIYDQVNKIFEYDKSELDFTFMDMMSTITIVKPFIGLLKKSNLLKNHENYKKLTEVIKEDELI